MELVGYWMEMRVFGGVPVFEHGNPPGEVNFLFYILSSERLFLILIFYMLVKPTAAWIHFPFRGVVQLSDLQLDYFARLGSPSALEPLLVDASALRFLPEDEARKAQTQDTYELGLFRNIYEHTPPPPINNQFRCVRRDVTYPDWFLEELKKS